MNAMTLKHPRLARELTTIDVMIGLYCRHQHQNRGLCPDCQVLREYAEKRLEKCPFQEGKTVCAKCPVHCYEPDMRQKVRAVMRYSGPRMIYRHPVLAVRHIIDSRRREPVR